ncbi:MAG TPA: DUF1501 domain-containing protein [Planctomycetaceae bacterium]|jgi:uncharacterized protein (DUF1501 family)|nr:DUF1501 domain-containing protein [Planctomycetaceae bacterium]
MNTRRDFLKQAALISLAPTVPAFLAQTARGATASPDQRILVVIQLTGGNDGLNMVVPYIDDNYYRLRPKLAVTKDRVLKLGGAVGLNPRMGDAADLYHDGRLMIVQGVGYPNPNKSHDVSMSIWQTARFDPTEHRGYGWLGRALDESAPASGGPSALLVGSDLPPVALRGRRSVAASLENLDDLTVSDAVRPHPVDSSRSDESLAAYVRRSTLDTLTTADRLKQSAKHSADSATPPGSELAGHLALVSRLIKSDFGARVYYAIQSGYDTHAFQRDTHDRLLSDLSQALRFFLDDLKRAKLDDRVLVMTFSEFGRRVDENASEGTDHGTAAPLFLVGAKIKSGLHGTQPKLPAAANVDPVATTDFRQVYQAVLENWLRLPAPLALDGHFSPLGLF